MLNFFQIFAKQYAFFLQKCTIFVSGLVNAHTRLVERTWNGLQYIEPKTTRTTTVRAIVGNKKIGKGYHDITVEREGWYCWHQDNNRRVEVR
jgi:hypothetical protein